MAAIRPVTDRFAVAPQIATGDLATLAAEGWTAVICNRPDGEEAGQPSASIMREAAEAAGLAFTHIPVAGSFPLPAVEAMRDALEAAPEGKVLAWCRSGTRSVTLWAMAQALQGADAVDLIAAAQGAGYDLSGLEGALVSLAGR